MMKAVTYIVMFHTLLGTDLTDSAEQLPETVETGTPEGL
jgi:hypothetical protein